MKHNWRRRNRHGKKVAQGNQSLMPALRSALPRSESGNNQTLVSTGAVLAHRFNDDLLLSEHDRQLAQQEFPEIYHILDHPELREQFLLYDGVANRAKLWVHRIGLSAVLLSVLALLGSALTPILHQMPDVPEWVFTVLFWAEIGGIIGVFIAIGGMWIAGQKRKWLEARMMAEVLRHWHFETMVCRGAEIESSCNIVDAGLTAYRASRALKFQAFLHNWSATPDSHLSDLIENPEAGYQLLHDEPTKYTPGSPVLDKIFGAYKLMRFRHQGNYATHKLQKQTTKPFNILKWPSAVLQQRTQGFAAFCLLSSLVCSTIIVIGHVARIQFAANIGWSAGIIGLLVLTVAGRAVQDGLAAPEELQRYNDYAGKIRFLLGRFDASHDPQERLQLMVEMERAALEELKGFLRAHSEARFVL